MWLLPFGVRLGSHSKLNFVVRWRQKPRRGASLLRVYNRGDKAAETRSSQEPTADRAPLLFPGICRALPSTSPIRSRAPGNSLAGD